MTTTTRRPKGAGGVRERASGFEATFSFLASDGRRVRQSKRGFRTKGEAREWLRARAEDVATGRGAEASAITLKQYLGEWLGSLGLAQLEAGTVAWYRWAVEGHIVPKLGAVRLARITPTMLEAFLADKAARGRLDERGGLGPGAVRALSVTLHKSLGAAVRKGLLARNPADLADRPRMPAPDPTLRVWAPADVARFLAATATDRLAALWRTAAMTGLRRSELGALQWSDLDLEGGALAVRRARVVVDGRVVEKGPKTARSRRRVDLDAETVAGLRRWKVAQLEERLRAGSAWAGGDWVAADELGRPLSPDWLSDRFTALATGAGLPPLHLRQLRHSHATALLAAGVSAKIVQERLGHASIAVTMDTYSSVLPTMQRDAVERLAVLIRG